MKRLLYLVVFGVSVSGCASPPPVTKTPTIARGQLDPSSVADINTAVEVARRSKYFPGGRVAFVQAVNRHKINIYYGQEVGSFVAVERIHGHWRAVYLGAWNS